MNIKEISNKILLQELDDRLRHSEATISEQKELLKELVELNSKLEESEKLKSHFLSNIRNEINNPLASILAVSQNLINKFKGEDGFLFNSLKIIYNEAFNLGFQIKNIMMAADLEAGEAYPEFENISLNTQVNNVLKSFESSIQKKEIKIAFDQACDTYLVTDQAFLNLILSNLIDNAIKFNVKGGLLSVHVLNETDYTEIKISDEGVGIDESRQEKIFDRFAQLEKGTTKNFGGHGLGLSIVKELLNLLGGQLHIESKIREGASFIIKLPIKAKKPKNGDISYNGNVILFDGEEQF